MTEEFSTITLRGKEIKTIVKYCPVGELEFYPENPRIYTIVGASLETPSQEDIFEALSKMDHVNQLVQSIKANGGLHEPIIVRNNIVLEGNSRLAAYQILAHKDPTKWGNVKCKILPENIDDDLVFSLLGEYHIIGKKDWYPFEQAGYLYRRYKIHERSIEDIAKELSLSVPKVKHQIQTYEFMLRHNDNNTDRWSYYDEYLKIKNINQLRCDYNQLDNVIVSKIQSGDIEKAADVRDKLKVILCAKQRTINKFLSGDKSFEDAFQDSVAQGNSDHCYKKLNSFRNWIVDLDTEEELINLPKEIGEKCLFEIQKIQKHAEKLAKKISSMKNQQVG